AGKLLWKERLSGGRSSVVLSPDGKTVAVAAGPEPQTIRILDVASGRQLRALEGGWVNRGATVACFSPDGSRLVTRSDNGPLLVWNVAGDDGARNLEITARASAAAFTPDGKVLVTLALVSGSELVQLWDPATGREVSGREGHDDAVAALAFSPDGKRLFSAGF